MLSFRMEEVGNFGFYIYVLIVKEIQVCFLLEVISFVGVEKEGKKNGKEKNMGWWQEVEKYLVREQVF